MTDNTPHLLIANVPGYLPNTEPVQFDSRDEAVAARRDEMIHGADQLADTFGEFHPIIAEWVDSFDSDDDAIYLPMSDSEHDLGVCFEIVPVH